MNDDEKYWVALSTHQKIGARTLLKLYKKFGTMQAVWSKTENELLSSGLDAGQVKAVLEVVAKTDPDKELTKLYRYQIKPVIITSPNYPKILREIADPPGLLYVKGELDPNDMTALAVVGSRKFSAYGERAVAEIVRPLAQAGLTIVSGLALGIDTLAHAAALEAEAKTVAVLGCGLDQIYPSSNIRLADKIVATGGAIVSEFPLGRAAMKFNFPIRNRIIAGLSIGTLVIEAAVESGSLITAQAALEYNREVFAVPGSVFSETSAGPNHLIQMGAKLVSSADDVLAELNLEKSAIKEDQREIIPSSPEEKAVLLALTQPANFDIIVEQTCLTPSQVNSILVMLEIRGIVKNLGGAVYERRGKVKENS